jgi:DNA-3-methyladenine glycosylase I
MTGDLRRCPWARTPLDVKHHDEEWGVPCHDDGAQFEMLMLEGAQAGLPGRRFLPSARTIGAPSLSLTWKQSHDLPQRIYAAFWPIPALFATGRSSRPRSPTLRPLSRSSAIPAHSTAISGLSLMVDQSSTRRARLRTYQLRQLCRGPWARPLAKRGFRFVGPKICYAFMQSVGLVNDHIVGCFHRREICAP